MTKMIIQMSPVDWITNERTGKQYLVLDTDDLVHDDNQQVCHSHGGHLPEPRDVTENQFLDSLGTEMFTLGMTDLLVEGQWVWDSDGSPVTWAGWIFSEPNGGTGENSALMVRNMYSSYAEHKSDGWIDYGYAKDKKLSSDSNPKSLICQREPGMCTSLLL